MPGVTMAKGLSKRDGLGVFAVLCRNVASWQ